jgi:NUMOD4 motif/HNH endonuclease
MSHSMYVQWSEIWEPVEGFPNYEVSTCGRVRNRGTMHILSPCDNGKGYQTVHLCHFPEKSKRRTIHRLVAIAFLENPEGKPEVNHIDGNKSDNFLSNLEWATSSENQLHAFATGLRRPSKIKAVEQLTMGGKVVARFESMRKAAMAVGLKSKSSIQFVVSGKCETAAGSRWRLASSQTD